MVSFCRTSWLLGLAKPVRSGTSQRQVRPDLLQCVAAQGLARHSQNAEAGAPGGRDTLLGSGTCCWAGDIQLGVGASGGSGALHAESQVTQGWTLWVSKESVSRQRQPGLTRPVSLPLPVQPPACDGRAGSLQWQCHGLAGPAAEQGAAALCHAWPVLGPAFLPSSLPLGPL